MSKFKSVLFRNGRIISVLAHVQMIVAANASAFWLRFDGDIPPAYEVLGLQALPALVAIRLATFLPLRLFEGLWRYTSLWDLRNILLGVGISTVLFIPLVSLLGVEQSYPRSIFIVDAVLLVCLMSGIRLTRRIYGEVFKRKRGRRVLVYGAGDAGEMIVRDMRQNEMFDAVPVGFVDDDPRKAGQRIHGVPVLGGRDRLARIIPDKTPHEVLIAIPSASARTLRTIVRALEPYKVRITTLPRLADLSGQRVGVSKIRPLSVEDLLARAPVGLDPSRIDALVRGQRVLVTGAGGSIGSELCRQILQANPARLVMLDRYENSLFAIHAELLRTPDSRQGTGAMPDSRLPTPGVLVPAIGDVTDAERLEQVFAAERPAVVFHAAAHKHVPMMEANPCEAVKNNVRGTRLVADAALRWGADRVVLISTDKAVNPASVMGATKLLAERIVQRYGTVGSTTFCSVRFGNVLGSNGSVVPTFLDQIRAGGPVTVTDPEMRRFFMLIPEAVQLVLHAAALDDGRGSVYVLDMGEQIRVADMARDLIRLSGYVPDEDIEIAYTGIRPGEKLFEELVGPGEVAEASEVDNVQRVRTAPDDTNGELAARLEHLERLAVEGDAGAVMAALCELVPALTDTPKLSAGIAGH